VFTGDVIQGTITPTPCLERRHKYQRQFVIRCLYQLLGQDRVEWWEAAVEIDDPVRNRRNLVDQSVGDQGQMGTTYALVIRLSPRADDEKR
jgi:hypothetical protein